MADQLSTSEVAERVGIHRDTLLRWLRQGIVPEPSRDRNGWRSFSESDANAVIAYATQIQSSGGAAVPEEFSKADFTLDQLDWDFAGAKTNYLTHSIHPYPAKFIPQIPNALIQELSKVGDTVADIFCGSGTTPVEALTLKRHAVSLDANPLACLITNAKTTVLTDAELDLLSELIDRAQIMSDTFSTTTEEELFPREPFRSKAWRPSFNKLTFWFAEHVIEELAEILSWCREIQSNGARNAALTAFSAIVVAVSWQDSDTRYVRRDKKLPPGETFRKFTKSLSQVRRAVAELSDLVEPRFNNIIRQANLLDRPEIPALDLMVCSPPYPNAFSYHLYHMTRMIWLSMDQPTFKQNEIGSHRKYSLPGKNAATADTFRAEFAQILQWLASSLKPGGHACFVVGDSTLKGEVIKNADLISELGAAAGYREVGRIVRTIQSTKKSFNPAIGKIKKEDILVLEHIGGAR